MGGEEKGSELRESCLAVRKEKIRSGYLADGKAKVETFFRRDRRPACRLGKKKVDLRKEGEGACIFLGKKKKRERRLHRKRGKKRTVNLL